MPFVRAWALGILLLALATTARADNWPAWRGPTGQGHSTESNLPLNWSATKNVKWKVELENPGNSTPVVWGDRIFLTQANKDANPKKDEKGKIDNKARRDGTIRSLLCLSRIDGKVLWQQDVRYDTPETNWPGISYCNASPVTDGERVVVSFGSAGMYCFDFNGKELWKRTDLGKWEHPFGNGSSPVIHGDLAILWCGPNEKVGRNYLIAVNKATGKTVWEHDESFGSWSTPLIAKVNGKDQLLLGQSRDVKNAPESKNGYLKGFDPATGKELWKCQGLNSYVYTSPLVADGLAVNMCGYEGADLAVKLGGSGDITSDRLWRHPKPATQRVGSGVIVGEHVYMVDEEAVPHCYELKTGKDLWKDEDRFKGMTWSSMVHADGRIYLLMRSGETLVLAAKPKFEILATNSLGRGEETNSSIAISNGDIFIRTFKHLWCIGEKKQRCPLPDSNPHPRL
jgi:outer membrane protein assembly factor BamB